MDNKALVWPGHINMVDQNRIKPAVVRWLYSSHQHYDQLTTPTLLLLVLSRYVETRSVYNQRNLN